MEIVVDSASWLRAAAGGILIGVSAVLLLAFSGRIAGISGALGGLVLDRSNGDRLWRAAFLLGLLGGAALIAMRLPQTIGTPTLSWGGLVLAGLLVGYGTRMGNGCTSGHGICGLARFSRRSFVATLSFMGAGFVTVFIIRHLLGAMP
jgi:uncharacterized membrane protein YedE/YeeE